MKRRDFLRLTGRVVPAGLALPRLAPVNTAGGRARTAGRIANPDYVIVGAGSSGSVLAHRLSANPKVQVVVLEAGVSGEADPAITTPGRWVSLLGSSYDWNYRTEAVAGLGDRRIAFPRGKALGGSSAINAMTHIRGHRLCFDRWLELGNPGWGYDDVLPLFKRSERNESGASEFRGGDGPLAVSFCWDPHDAHRAFLTAAIHAGYRSDARFDFNTPNPVGVAGYYQKNILDGRRHSAAAAFLVPAMSRPNLEVRSRAIVTRLVVEGTRVVGVEYQLDGQRAVVRAAREVVLSAGVVDSPRLLMLSGIGPADHLKSSGVAVVADVPGVGQNFQDHLKLSIRWNGLTDLPGSTVTAGLFTTSGSTWPPDLQFYVGRGLEEPDRFITITVSLVRPRSRGEIRLASSDPGAPALIRPNYLQEQADVDALVHGVRLARLIRIVLRLRSTAGRRDRARAGGHLAGGSAALRAPRGRHHLPRRRHLPHGPRVGGAGGGGFRAARAWRARPPRGRRVDHAGGGECDHPRGERDDWREGSGPAEGCARRRWRTAARGASS